MAFTGEYTLAQNDESTITLVDASTGSDPNIYQRVIRLFKYDGSTVVPSGTTTAYIDWPIVALAGDSITLTDIFDKDYALNVEVTWVTTLAIANSVYVVARLYLFKEFLELFAASLTSEAGARYPSIVNNKNYFYNKTKLRTLIDDAVQSVSKMNDIYKAQFCLYMGEQLRQNPSLFF